MAQFLDGTPLTMEFEDGELVKVSGSRPDYMDGQSLIRLVKRLAKLNLGQELEINRYRAEVDDLNAECGRISDRFEEAQVFERRDLFAGLAMVATLLRPETDVSSPDDLPAFDKAVSGFAYRMADAMEAARPEKEPG